MKKILELEEVLFENISFVLSVDLMFGLRWARCREGRRLVALHAGCHSEKALSLAVQQVSLKDFSVTSQSHLKTKTGQLCTPWGPRLYF